MIIQFTFISISELTPYREIEMLFQPQLNLTQIWSDKVIGC